MIRGNRVISYVDFILGCKARIASRLQVCDTCWGNEAIVNYLIDGHFVWRPMGPWRAVEYRNKGGAPPGDYVGLNYYSRWVLLLFAPVSDPDYFIRHLAAVLFKGPCARVLSHVSHQMYFISRFIFPNFRQGPPQIVRGCPLPSDKLQKHML